MSLFEFAFALNAVVLGLALTHIAASLHKLLLAGRRVTWSAEPILLTAIVLLVIITVWLGAWSDRNETSVSVEWTILQVLKLLTLYIAAASCLPEPETSSSDVNTFEYYDRTRALSFGALIVSYMLFEIGYIARDGLPNQITFSVVKEWFLYPAIYGLLIILRARWFNILMLAFALLYYCYAVVGFRLSSG